MGEKSKKPTLIRCLHMARSCLLRHLSRILRFDSQRKPFDIPTIDTVHNTYNYVTTHLHRNLERDILMMACQKSSPREPLQRAGHCGSRCIATHWCLGNEGVSTVHRIQEWDGLGFLLVSPSDQMARIRSRCFAVPNNHLLARHHICIRQKSFDMILTLRQVSRVSSNFKNRIHHRWDKQRPW